MPEKGLAHNRLHIQQAMEYTLWGESMRNLKISLLVSAILLIIAFSPAALAETRKRGLNLKLSGGVGSFTVGDFNTFFGDTVPYYENAFSPYGFARQGEYEKLGKAWGASGELLLDLSRVVSLGAAVGYQQADKQSSLTWAHPELNTFSVDIASSLNVVSVMFTAYANVPLTPAIHSYVNGGFGIYKARATFDYLEDSRILEEENTFTSEIQANRTGFGIHGGLGLELKLSSGLAVFTEGSYRHVKLDSVYGLMKTKTDSAFPETVSGELWYFEMFEEESSLHLSGISFGEKPKEEGLTTRRELELDLSGFTLKIGFRIRFAVWE
jgi:opacity protein-like surface antigen